MRTTGEGAGAPDGALEDEPFLPREQTDQDKQTAGCTEPGIPWPGVTITSYFIPEGACCLLTCNPRPQKKDYNQMSSQVTQAQRCLPDSAPRSVSRLQAANVDKQTLFTASDKWCYVWSPVPLKHMTKFTRTQG